MKLFSTYALLAICFTATAQTFTTTKVDWYRADRYTDSVGRSVTIQNSFPKGAAYTDPTGRNLAYRIFFTRVVNESINPLALTIQFPADSFARSSTSDSYLKVFLPPDTMSLDKHLLYDYGATGLKSFLDGGVHKPTSLQRTVAPGEDCLFYVGVLFFGGGNAVTRTELVLEGQELYYKIVPEIYPASIPCGKIGFDN